jgi:hypothetical protein
MERLSSLSDITRRIELEVDDLTAKQDDFPEEPVNEMGETRFLSRNNKAELSV